MVALGDTFLGGEEVHGEHHLWIVINDPAYPSGGVALGKGGAGVVKWAA